MYYDYCLLVLQGMESMKVKRKEGKHGLQVARGSKDNPTIWHYANTSCKIEKEMDLNWSRLYHDFTHEDYSHLLYDEEMEDKEKSIYNKIAKSHLHKFVARPTVLPCMEVVGILVQQLDVLNQWLIDAHEKTLEIYHLKQIHGNYIFPILEVYMPLIWLNNAQTKHNLSKLLKEWITPRNTFHMTSQGRYKDSIFLKHI